VRAKCSRGSSLWEKKKKRREERCKKKKKRKREKVLIDEKRGKKKKEKKKKMREGYVVTIDYLIRRWFFFKDSAVEVTSPRWFNARSSPWIFHASFEYYAPGDIADGRIGRRL